jgi:hypothetical protein
MVLHNILIGTNDDFLDDPIAAAQVEQVVAAERARRAEFDGAGGAEVAGEPANERTRRYVKHLCEQNGYQPAYDELGL